MTFQEADGDLFAAALKRLMQAVVQALESDPDLLARVRFLLKSQPADSSPADEVPFMSVAEYARHARVSERTIRYQLSSMTEQVHFHRDGRTGRRVVMHVREADKWRAARREAPGEGLADLERLAIDEVTRRRARVALRRHTGVRS